MWSLCSWVTTSRSRRFLPPPASGSIVCRLLIAACQVLDRRRPSRSRSGCESRRSDRRPFWPSGCGSRGSRRPRRCRRGLGAYLPCAASIDVVLVIVDAEMRRQLEPERAIDTLRDVSGGMRLRPGAPLRLRAASPMRPVRDPARQRFQERRPALRALPLFLVGWRAVAGRLATRLARPRQQFAVLVQRERAAAQQARRPGRRSGRTARPSSTTSSRQTYCRSTCFGSRRAFARQLLRGAQIRNDDVGVGRDEQLAPVVVEKAVGIGARARDIRSTSWNTSRSSRSKTWCGLLSAARVAASRMPRLMKTSSIIPR